MSAPVTAQKHTPFYGFDSVGFGLPPSRKRARATGAKQYFTGKPCKRGHVAPRYLSSGECAECLRQWERSPKMREYRREYDREYQRSYKPTPKMRAYSLESNRRRQASKRLTTPNWLTPAQIDEMRAIYAEAQRLTDETGVPHHVDHIIPLTHPDVRGLHVPWNLQILTAEDNCRKNNAFDGTHENESWRQK